MKENLIIIDNFLPDSIFNSLHDFISELDYSPAARKKWQKQYDPTGTVPLECNSIWSFKKIVLGSTIINEPENHDLTIFKDKLFKIKDQINKVIDQQLDNQWDTFTIRSFLYPRGTALGWHTDGLKLCAYSYYLHKNWYPDWGGELTVSTCEKKTIYETDKLGYSHKLSAYDGRFFFPKPNRLVLIGTGVWHSVKRIECAAGSNMRISLSGFFFNSNKINELNG